MAYGESLRGVEFQSNNGTVFRCFFGDSDTLTFQIFRGVDGLESTFEGGDRKELVKLLYVLVRWIGLEDAKKVIDTIERKKQG